MSSSTNGVANFIVMERPAVGNPIEHAPNSTEYTFIASAINIALSMLETQNGRYWLTDLATQVDRFRKTQHGGSRFRGDHSAVRPWIDWFLTKLRARFPAVVINHTMTNIDVLGATSITPWDGDLSQFDPRVTMIHLNGSRVRDMLAAESQGRSQRFRDFQFLFAGTLLHEAGGHVLTIFLNNGRVGTPAQVTVTGYGNQGTAEGESGRWLELNLFGGTSEYYRDPNQGAGQTGIPHQIDASGWAWRIDPDTINRVVQYQFEFPFRRVGNAVDPRTMQQMGRNSQENPTENRERQMQAYLAHDARSIDIRGLRGYTVRVRELRAIPTDMRRRLTPVASS